MKSIKIAIVSAINIEYQAIISIMSHPKEKCTGYMVGKINGVCCVATQSGIGALAVQRSVYDIMKKFKPKILIYSGIAGSRNSAIKIGDVVVSGFVCAKNAIYFSPQSVLSQYDAIQFKKDNTYIDMTIISGYKYLCKLAEKAGGIIGIIGTSDFYVESQQWLETFNAVYHADVGENEGIGFAYVSETFDIPFIIIRGISDSVYQPNSGSESIGAQAAANVLKKMLCDITFNFSLERITINDLSQISLGTTYGSVVSNDISTIPPQITNK